MANQSRMLEEAPVELRPGGMLLYDESRDGRFPYIYAIDAHPHVYDRDPSSSRRILLFIQDTSREAMEKLKLFEDSLEVPLGPNASMAGSGDLFFPTFSYCRIKH
jgi:hypothetical protein